jgi:hypothetical protein
MPKFASRRIIALSGLLTLAGTVGYWMAKGAHRGWSQHRVPVSQTDEVTGIAFTTYENRFVPGLEILAGGVALAGGLFALSFFVRTPPSSNSNP